MMKFWKLTDRLRVYEPVRTIDEFQSEHTEYVDTGRLVWCDRNRHTGTMTDEVGEHFPDYRAEFRLRIESLIPEQWRVVMVGEEDITYEVISVLRDKRLGMATLKCERINP